MKNIIITNRLFMKIRNDIKMEIIFLTKSNIKQYLILCYLLTLRITEEGH